MQKILFKQQIGAGIGILAFKMILNFLRLTLNYAVIATSGRMYLVPNTTLRGPGLTSLYNIFILD